MIVPMRKVYMVCRRHDRQRLLDALGELGVVHITPVDPSKAVVDEQLSSRIALVDRALQVLGGIASSGHKPAESPIEAAEQVLDIQRRQAERENQLTSLHRELERVSAVWGDLRLDQLEALNKAGVMVRFYSVPVSQIGEIKAECVQPLRELPGRRTLTAVVHRSGEPEVPASAEPIALPQRDGAAIREEAARIEAERKQASEQLAALALLADAMRAERDGMQQQACLDVADKSGLDGDHLYAMQGWVPAETSQNLAEQLRDMGMEVGLRISEPDLEERPPTEIRYAGWVRPIEGLFKILGTVAGYREFDVSVPFMLALPIFAAMLISDGGYGAILFFGPLILYKKVAPTLGTRFTQLMMVIGAVSLIYGLLCGSFFGWWPSWAYAPPLPAELAERSRENLMNLSFIIGAIHLSVAQLLQAARLYPDSCFLNRVGWAAFVWGVLGEVRTLVLGAPFSPVTTWLLIIGAALAILFACPTGNILIRLLRGVADFPLSMLSAFSDIISYVRLMAVGLASTVLATNFNEMAFSADFWPLTILVLVFGHGLNIGLAMIALFAHGVRLNMLEFSNNLGMQWSGYPYQPFRKQTVLTQEN